MITYQLVDKDNNIYQIPSSVVFKLKKEDQFKLENNFFERSYEDGGVKVGSSRMQSKELTFEYINLAKTNNAFRDTMNTLLSWFNKAVLIKDIINGLETRIDPTEQSIAYADGSYLRYSTNEITFKVLNPFWEKSYPTTINSESPGTSHTFTIVNSGKLATPPTITLTAISNDVTKFLIKCAESKKGIVIQDFDFSQNGLMTYTIDNKAGLASLQSVNLNRNNKIKKGTGFFKLIPGTNTLTIQSNGNVNVEISYRERFYI